MGLSLNAGLPEGTTGPRPAAPLAFDPDLDEAASSHTGWIVATCTFSHTRTGGSRAVDRMITAG